MATPTTSQPFVDHPADVASEQAREDLANLRAAYAALNDGNLGPITALLDRQVHLRGPEHGHLWWKSHRTWNGPADVEAALAPQRSSSDTPRRQIHAGEPTRISGRFMVECHLIPPDDTSDTTRDEHGRDGAFYEVVTIRDGKIVRFADYRSRTIARGAATANY
jgi:ketosteroid isomerase-like protein